MLIKLVESLRGQNLNEKGLKVAKRVEAVIRILVILIFIAVIGVIGLNFFQHNQEEKSQVAAANQEETSALEGTDFSERDNAWKREEEKQEVEKEESAEPEKSEVEEETEVVSHIPAEVQARGYCNSFAGYTAAIVANGGLTTQEDSYYAKAGINVSIGIEDNDDVIIEAFKNGEIDFFFMTVNKMSLICKELEEAGVDVVIPYLSDSSTGGDGIVAKEEFGSIEALKDTKIAMARNSVSSTVPVWFMNTMTNLEPEEVETIIHNFALYDSTQEAVDAFLRGECGAVSTWDMNTALEAEGSQLLFSTKEGEYLVIDALVVNKNYAIEHPEVVTAMVDGCIQVSDDLSSGNREEESYDIIRASVPDFTDYDDETMKELLESSRYLGYQKNVEVFGMAAEIYTDFCKIWEQLGFETDPEYVNSLFDRSVLEALAEKWEGKEELKEKETLVATEETIADKEALLSKSCTILFEKDSWDFLVGSEEENYASLDEFVKAAKILNRMLIKVEGNISLKPGEKATEFGRMLALKRAERIRDYMIEQGIEPERLIAVANVDNEPEVQGVVVKKVTAEQARNCTTSFYRGEE